MGGGIDSFIFTGSGLNILDASEDGSAIIIPDGSWIKPQTENDTITITNGLNPSDIYSNMTLSEGALQLRSGNGIKNHAYLNMFEDIITMGTNPTSGVGDTLNIGNGASQILVKGNNLGVFESNIVLGINNGNSQISLNDEGAYFNKGILIGGYRPDYPQGPTAIILPNQGMIGNSDYIISTESRLQAGPTYTDTRSNVTVSKETAKLIYGDNINIRAKLVLDDNGILLQSFDSDLLNPALLSNLTFDTGCVSLSSNGSLGEFFGSLAFNSSSVNLNNGSSALDISTSQIILFGNGSSGIKLNANNGIIDLSSSFGVVVNNDLTILGTTTFGNYTTIAKTALTGTTTGTQIYDSTLGKMCFYNGSAWETITSV